MNRAQRRRNQPPSPRPWARVRLGHGNPRQGIACPDCNSEVIIIQLAQGLGRAEVRHDDSCPWYAQLKRDLA